MSVCFVFFPFNQINLLFFNNTENILRDCIEMEEGAEVDMTQADCEMVQDYRLMSKKAKPPKKRNSHGPSNKPRHLLYSRTIPDIVNADQDPEWKVLATNQISGRANDSVLSSFPPFSYSLSLLFFSFFSMTT
jgi:hypothetical protein